MAKIYVYRDGGITTAGIEGSAIDLNEGIKRYQKNKNPRFCVDFSPLFKEKDERLFLVGNVYVPEVCTSVFYQHTDGRSANTSISCHGTSDDAIGLLKEFGKTLEFKTIEPTEQFKDEVRIAHMPIEAIWRRAEKMGRDNQKFIFAAALGLMNQTYRVQKAKIK